MQILVGFGILFLLLAIGVHVASVLFVIGAGGAWMTLGSAVLLDFGNQVWSVLNSFVMTAIPLFVLLGELLLRSGITDKVYQSMSLWLARLPGGLLHTNIGASALLAATSGSSVATAATIGTVAIPTFKTRGYNDRIVLGSLAAGGTLGILIPPSINMIIYGSIADASIGRLFIGGLVPGIMLALAFMTTIMIIAVIRPSVTGEPEEPRSFVYKIKTLGSFLPSLIIIFAVMGSIYLGWATPTEAAALGVLAVVVIALVQGRLSIAMLHESFASTIKTTAMILLIMACAFYMNFIISMLGIPQALSQWFVQFNLSPQLTMWLIVVFYIVLGTFIETIAMMVTTIPLVVPLVVAVGYDPVWFGVFLMILCEASLITPPIGMNLYVVQGIRTDNGPLKDVIIGVLPFLLTMLLMVGVMIYVPELVLWLPDRMLGF
ncbi:TRAP transporter large permease [Desulfofustis glycolicus]|uniref:TRAP transporter, DctM subunit n=1 Tax=Desulfofustis glycolicus DSM 9705 TaxID=1121409 RepID=A0A1M5RYL0_9BACT|nr:TRAP transporter large permease [Desulfofustis glycolicus]MCB2216320.1 TRAP transporter large permease [Desulfobulbaceae bacterium]SHH31264.1 TRAP transporter, DctM subunit [Desulfofustis glycolicus DSM 9705]